jgi:hypothetical protein
VARGTRGLALTSRPGLTVSFLDVLDETSIRPRLQGAARVSTELSDP